MTLIDIGKQAKKSAAWLANAGVNEKNAALIAMADAIETSTAMILDASEKDLVAAEKNGMTASMMDRLRLTEERLRDIADAVRFVVGLDDPVGKIQGGERRPNGMEITKISVPLGVVGVIFEARPNVTADCAALCLKSGNACILRGGKEAIHSNRALVQTMRNAIESVGFPADAVQLIQDTSREIAFEMMRLNGYIDLLIPRGGAALIASVVQNATVPVIETGAGNCHIFVDATADLVMAVDIIENSKSRPSVCNAVETVLVHQDIAAALLPLLKTRLDKVPIELRGCSETVRILGDSVVLATEADWSTEYNDAILAVRVVPTLDEAIAHIEAYSTHHSEAIITQNYSSSQRFTQQVDSAAVYVNASTRFTDGGEFGFGAELGISTQKLHARGPMGLTHLTSYKYIVTGSGQIRR